MEHGPGLGAREATTPELRVRDSGLLAHLLGAGMERIEDDDRVTGKLCETCVAGELPRHASRSEQQPRLYHYQRDREDVDLVLENNRGQIVGVEVKASATLRANDWKWLAKLAELAATRSVPGSSCTPASRRFRLGPKLWAVPYSGLWVETTTPSVRVRGARVREVCGPRAATPVPGLNAGAA